MNFDLYRIQVIRAQDFEDTMKAADQGEEMARQFMIAFAKWDKATRECPALPGCFSCGTIIEPDNFGGAAYAHRDDANGLIGSFCMRCQRKGWTMLANLFVDQVSEATGKPRMTIQ